MLLPLLLLPLALALPHPGDTSSAPTTLADQGQCQPGPDKQRIDTGFIPKLSIYVEGYYHPDAQTVCIDVFSREEERLDTCLEVKYPQSPSFPLLPILHLRASLRSCPTAVYSFLNLRYNSRSTSSLRINLRSAQCATRRS